MTKTSQVSKLLSLVYEEEGICHLVLVNSKEKIKHVPEVISEAVEIHGLDDIKSAKPALNHVDILVICIEEDTSLSVSIHRRYDFPNKEDPSAKISEEKLSKCRYLVVKYLEGLVHKPVEFSMALLSESDQFTCLICLQHLDTRKHFIKHCLEHNCSNSNILNNLSVDDITSGLVLEDERSRPQYFLFTSFHNEILSDDSNLDDSDVTDAPLNFSLKKSGSHGFHCLNAFSGLPKADAQEGVPATTAHNSEVIRGLCSSMGLSSSFSSGLSVSLPLSTSLLPNFPWLPNASFPNILQQHAQSVPVTSSLGLIHSFPGLPSNIPSDPSPYRNVSKNIKCPKCNWHYKYQETLEIHLKEKHPETQSDQADDSSDSCHYCTTNQSHPRLARGESYNCGYKPYRCEVCNYSTTTKGNLAIHMQSDKHNNNVQDIQRSQSNNGHAQQGSRPIALSLGMSSLNSAFHHPGSLMNNSKIDVSPIPSQEDSNLSCRQESGKPVYRCEVCDYDTSIYRNLKVHLTSEKHTANITAFHAPVQSDSSSNNCKDISKTFSCQVCEAFETDFLTDLHTHSLEIRSESDPRVTYFSDGLWFCSLCEYKSNLKANFHLHCKTDKHMQRLQFMNHLKLGGQGNMKKYNASSLMPVQMRCNVCHFVATSLPKMQVHLSLPSHQLGAYLLMHLVRHEDGLSSKSKVFECILCRKSFPTKSDLLHHFSQPLHKLEEHKLQDQGAIAELDKLVTVRVVSDEESASSPESSEGKRDSEAAIKLSTSSGMPLLVCPCCQQGYENDETLEDHLRKDHLITDSKLNVFTKMAATIQSPQTDGRRQRNSKENRLALMTANPAEEADIFFLTDLTDDQFYRCQTCSMTFVLVDELFEHQSKVGHTEMQQTPRGPGYLCWRKGCNQYFKSLDNLHIHFNEIHKKSSVRPVNAKFPHSCSYCCLAFKDKDLQMQHQNHHNEKNCESFCIVCMQTFDQMNDLKLHYENRHLQGVRTVEVPSMVVSDGPERSPSTPSTSKPDAQVESDDSYATAVFKCEYCHLGFGAQIQLAAHMRSNAHKRAVAEAQNMRCLACGVSFTGQEQLEEHLRSPGHQLRLQLTFAGGNPFFLPLMKMNPGEQNETEEDARSGQFAQLPVMFPPNLFLPPLIPAPTAAKAPSLPTSTKPSSPVRASEAVDSVSDGNNSSSGGKRARTRISEEQLRILRANFNLNNSPSDDCIARMSADTGLPVKVIKHWFRNTLFKERQRSKDSPYNFNIPPATQLNLEEYERSGKVEVHPAKPEEVVQHIEAQMQASSNRGAKKRQRSSAGSNSGDSTKEQENEMPSLKRHKASFLQSDVPIFVDDSSNHSFDLSMNMDDPNNRRPRTLINAEQTDVLNLEYKNNSNPTRKQLEAIAKRVGLAKRVVQVWFQNYRARERRINAPPRLISAPNNTNSDGDAPLDLSQGSSLGSYEVQPPSLSTQPPLEKVNNSGYINPIQTYILRSVFREFKSPTFEELEILCSHTNLSRGVMEVWFKNNISKERRLFEDSELPETSGCLTPGNQCDICCSLLPEDVPVRSHIFSTEHLENLIRKAQTDKGGLPVLLPNTEKVGHCHVSSSSCVSQISTC